MGSKYQYRIQVYARVTASPKWHLAFSIASGIFHWNIDTNTKYSANRTVQQMVLLLGICIRYSQVLWNRRRFAATRRRSRSSLRDDSRMVAASRRRGGQGGDGRRFTAATRWSQFYFKRMTPDFLAMCSHGRTNDQRFSHFHRLFEKLRHNTR